MRANYPAAFSLSFSRETRAPGEGSGLTDLT